MTSHPLMVSQAPAHIILMGLIRLSIPQDTSTLMPILHHLGLPVG